MKRRGDSGKARLPFTTRVHMRRHQPPRFSPSGEKTLLHFCAISSRRIRTLAIAKYSWARIGSSKRRLLWAFEFRRPTIPLKTNMNSAIHA